MLFLIALFSLNSFASSDPQVVTQVDLNKYSGQWYDIAHNPNFFQKSCVHSTAEYKVLSADSISVHNTCFKKNGSTSEIKGVAKIADLKEPAKLKVTFNIFAKGDYWITELDPEYQWAVVSAPEKKSLFILSRVAPMDPALQKEILDRLTSLGYDTQHLVFDRY